MKFTTFGDKFTAVSGILQLMDDLGRAVTGGGETIMLGGGNPSHIPAVQAHFRARMAQLLADGGAFEHLIGDYDPPQGNPAFVTAVADLLRAAYGWPITARNVALTNGSQTAFFYLFNLLAGPRADGRNPKILLPVAPEYIGYVDVGLTDDIFVTARPQIDFLDDHTFKYRVDFDALPMTDAIGAICLSRPTNPTGNVLTDGEIERLRALARIHDVPLIIDNAYGAPFPSIIYNDVTPVWDEQIVLCLSLSKLGLPGARTGIVIANERIISAIAGMNAVLSLAPGSLGAGLAHELVRSGEILRVSRELIRPYYQQRAAQAQAWIRAEFADLDYYLHKPEGAFFFWLWFKELPISAAELYARLKARGVIVVPGHYFFPGLSEPWRHKQECIRVNYTPDAAKVRAGLQIIAEEARRAYAAG